MITFLVMLILISLLIINREKWTTREKWSRTAFWFYLYLIFVYAFLGRTGKNGYDINVMPFWSYQHIVLTHELRIVFEVLLNCLMFIPVGILVPWAYENILHEDETKKRNTVLQFGLIVSLTVEFLQFFTKTGLLEWDDIFHNMIGMLLGYGIYLFLKGKHFGEVHQYFLPMFGVVLVMVVAML
ncbi:VanZ family protein [Acetobacterium wieringae]|uniref:VanZ family protein n=1 Tax=Acetobacterium wieringae TaxID=52694 RepID=UPI002033BB5D|nr:VanZ family protein [Acetobacterium wieringae]URN84105.1 VanZ family protein [Acetobacterium wieringae]